MIDLYKDDIERAESPEVYEAIQELAANVDDENQRLEFKETIAGKAVPTVAAFANCFGGILILGVTDKPVPRQLKGVAPPGRQSLRSYLGQLIGARVFPFPRLEIATCNLDSSSNLQLAVVRVHEAPTLHWFVPGKDDKDRAQVWVRKVDGTVAAEALDLRSLQDRVASAATSTPAVEPWEGLEQLGFNWTGQRQVGDLSLSVTPSRNLNLLLDDAIEERFRRRVWDLPLRESPNPDEAGGGAQWSRLRREQSNPKGHRQVWVLRSSGAIMGRFDVVAPAPAPRRGRLFLPTDVLRHIGSVIRLARETWEDNSHFGDGTISAVLDLSLWDDESKTLNSDSAAYRSGMLKYQFPVAPPRACKSSADVRLSYSDLRDPTNAIVRLAIPLLRDAGISVNREGLADYVKKASD